MANNPGRGVRCASIVSYRECRRNSARQQGQFAVDGCRRFLNHGEEPVPPVAYFCAHCGCHRSLHRIEEIPIQVDPAAVRVLSRMHAASAAAAAARRLQAPPPAPAEQNLGDGEVEEVPSENKKKGKKRARFTAEQKEAMLRYAAAELEWSLQGHDEVDLRRFCQEIGITSQGFKVWIRNNKRRYMVEPAESLSASSSSSGGSI